MKKLSNKNRSKKSVLKFDLKMKLTTLFFILTLIGLHAKNGYSQKAKVTINVENATIRQVIDNIETSTKFKFIYKTKSVDLERKVSLKAKKQNVKIILSTLFNGTNTTYKLQGTQIILRARTTKAKPVQKQNSKQNQDLLKVTGIVLDNNGQPLPGANILEKLTNNGTLTNFDGEYSINVSSTNATLVISYVGFETKEISVDNQKKIDITLSPDTQSLDAVVVVGYGVQRRSDITGAVSSIATERLEEKPNNNFAQALQGSVAGVNIVSNSAGAEGNDVSILIRGRNSITANNQPLIVLDDVPFNGSISEINTADIASIEILKDASSAAIYGARGSNGVILITSKKGKLGKPRVSYDGFSGIQTLSNAPDYLTGAEFYDYKNTREPGTITDSEQAIFDAGEGVDWFDLTTRTGFKQQHTLSFSGRNENLNYYLSGTYLDVTGVAVNDDFSRISTRMNIEAKIGEWFTIGTKTQLAMADRGGVEADFEIVGQTNPLTTAFEENGDLTIYPWPEDVFFGNPLQSTLAINRDKNYSIFSNNYVIIDFPFPGLQYKLNTGVEYSGRDIATYYYGQNTKIGLEARGRADTQNRLRTNHLVENILSYNKTFGRHNIFATALYSYQNTVDDRRRLVATGFPNDVRTYYQANQADLLVPSNSYAETTLISGLLRLNYGYDDRYLVTLTTRRDGFSGFGEDNKYGNFPSVAVAWNISNEAFLRQNNTVNSLKLRFSYGENGNQAINAYETLSKLTDFRRGYLEGETTVPGYAPESLANSILGWESTTSANIGLDYGLFNNRITGSLEFYESNTERLLLNRQISPVAGVITVDRVDNRSIILQNIGKTRNKGFEFSINANVIQKRDFKWNINANVSYIKNEIRELYGDGNDDILNQWFIGQPIRVNYAYQFDGIFQEGDDIANSAQPDAQPGYPKIVDQNGDGNIDADNDRVVIGQRDPDFLTGLNMLFSYKNFSLDIFSYSAHGFTKYQSLLRDQVQSGVRLNTIRKNWWTPENPTNEYWANDVDANPRGVRIYEDGSFWRLRDVTLSYNLPRNFLDDIGLNSFTLYFTGRNLATITSYTGLDPELSDDREIPLQKEFIFGLNFGF